jgi:ATP-dependent Clp protease ATP-binding subunit ClpB
MLSEKAMAFLADKGYDPAYGARPLKRVIQQYIENPLSMKILQGDILPGNRIRIDLDGDNLVFHTRD